MKTDLFQSCDHCWVFQTCWHIECGTFTASSFRIWNSSTGISWPPLVLFVVMLPKAHSTSHSRMCGSRWVISYGYLGQDDLFCIVLLCILATSSEYLLLLLVHTNSMVRTISVLYGAHLGMKCSLRIPILSFSSISFHLSLRKAFLSLLAILWNSAFKWVYISFSPLPLTSLLFLPCSKLVVNY